MVVLTRSAAKSKQSEVPSASANKELKPSKQRTAVTLTDQKHQAAPKEPPALKVPPAPKENVENLSYVRESAKVAVNPVETLASKAKNEEKNIQKTGIKKKAGRPPTSKVSSTIERPEAATKQNPNANVKSSPKKSSKKPKSKNCMPNETLAKMPIQKAGKDYGEQQVK